MYAYVCEREIHLPLSIFYIYLNIYGGRCKGLSPFASIGLFCNVNRSLFLLHGSISMERDAKVYLHLHLSNLDASGAGTCTNVNRSLLQC